MKNTDPSEAETRLQIAREVVPIEDVLALLSQGWQAGGRGACIACGNQQTCVEPDARHRTCEECGTRWVFGAEELLFMMQA